MKISAPRALVATFTLFVLALLARPCSAQEEWKEAFDALLRQVEELRRENAELREEVTELKAEESSTVLEEELALLREDLAASAPYRRLGTGPLFRRDGSTGFADRIIYGGEWRTRGDARVNTADLLGELDDEGFRLDYRFNFGVGFLWDVGSSDESGESAKVKTWIEFQAAGRAANNTVENLPAVAGSSIGDFATRDNELDVVRLYQAYLQLDDILGVPSLMLKAGRQELIYGSKLILGTNEFYTGTVHDAVRVDYRAEFLGDANLSFFYAKEAAADGQVQPGLATGGLLAARFRASGDEDELVGIHMSDSTLLDPVLMDAYYVYFNSRSAPDSTRPDNSTSANDPAIDAFGRTILSGHIHTFGVWLRSDQLVEDFFFSLETAYQLGDDEEGETLDALAIELLVEWNLPFMRDENLRLHGGYYFAEGPDSGVGLGFSPLFISRHDNEPVTGHGAFSRFGNLDVIPVNNVHVFHVGVKMNPDPSWTIGATWFYAVRNHSREQLTLNPIGNVFLDDRQLGHEIDLYAVHQVSRQIELFFNASLFLPVADFVIEQVFPTTPGDPFEKFDTDVAVGVYAQVQIRF